MRRFGWLIAAGASVVALTAIMTAGVSARGAVTEQQAPGGATLTPDEIMAHQLKDEKGGNPAAGRPIFEKQCAICHRFGGIGVDVGPDLTTITSRFKKRDILESILYPSKVISDQYQSEMIETKDGKIVTGILVRESAALVVVRTADNPGKPVSVPKGQIATREVSTVSLMPEGLLTGLTQEQIADLLAFIQAPPPAK